MDKVSFTPLLFQFTTTLKKKILPSADICHPWCVILGCGNIYQFKTDKGHHNESHFNELSMGNTHWVILEKCCFESTVELMFKGFI